MTWCSRERERMRERELGGGLEGGREKAIEKETRQGGTIERERERERESESEGEFANVVEGGNLFPKEVLWAPTR